MHVKEEGALVVPAEEAADVRLVVHRRLGVVQAPQPRRARRDGERDEREGRGSRRLGHTCTVQRITYRARAWWGSATYCPVSASVLNLNVLYIYGSEIPSPVLKTTVCVRSTCSLVGVC